MSTTLPALDAVKDILDTDLILVEHANGAGYKLTGAELNKRNQVIIASSKTITGTPLKTGNVVRVLFTAELTAANASTTLVITYNSVNYNVKVCKDGALVNYTPFLIGSTYKYCQAYTTLEFIYDGTNFIVLGNPVVISSSDYTIYPDGTYNYTTNYINPIHITLANNSSSSKIFLLGKLKTTQTGRAGVCFDITYRRVDTVGRILGVFRAENTDNKYICFTPTYIPVAMDLYVVTTGLEYNVYCEVANYTPEVKITLSSLLNFVEDVQEVSAKSGTRIVYTPLALRYIAQTN